MTPFSNMCLLVRSVFAMIWRASVIRVPKCRCAGPKYICGVPKCIHVLICPFLVKDMACF